jgi:hypothetical protein
MQIAMDALSGRSMFSLGSPELLEDSRHSAAPRRYSMSMAYVDDRRPPEEAWGKKFNDLPLLKESGSMVTYHDAVFQISISSNDACLHFTDSGDEPHVRLFPHANFL